MPKLSKCLSLNDHDHAPTTYSRLWRCLCLCPSRLYGLREYGLLSTFQPLRALRGLQTDTHERLGLVWSALSCGTGTSSTDTSTASPPSSASSTLRSLEVRPSPGSYTERPNVVPTTVSQPWTAVLTPSSGVVQLDAFPKAFHMPAPSVYDRTPTQNSLSASWTTLQLSAIVTPDVEAIKESIRLFSCPNSSSFGYINIPNALTCHDGYAPWRPAFK